jgi:hypothetical protein
MTVRPTRKERYSPEVYRRFRRSVFLTVRFGVLWLGGLGALVALLLSRIALGEDFVVVAALLTSLFLFSLLSRIARLDGLLREPPNLMPYFKGTVPGCGLSVGVQLLDHSRELDALAQSIRVHPISFYISDDDLFDRRPPTWHQPAEAYATFDALLRELPTHPSVQAARDDIEHIRDRLLLAQASDIPFCLLLRDVHATNFMEWERRQGRF